jgi:hypothetical protein
LVHFGALGWGAGRRISLFDRSKPILGKPFVMLPEREGSAIEDMARRVVELEFLVQSSVSQLTGEGLAVRNK